MSKFKVTASALNVRRLPSIEAAILGTLNHDEIVTALETSQDQKWLKIDNENQLIGWASQRFLERVSVDEEEHTLSQITQLAASSGIATFNWQDRGVAPRGYIKGMSVAFARAYCKLKAGDPHAIDMAKADTGNPATDALAHYATRFEDLSMNNESSGVSTLRHLFVLLLGLGMRESSGRWCEGRDHSASNTTATTAEAGMFQTSFNLNSASPLLASLFAEYEAGPNPGQVDPASFHAIFTEGVTPTTQDLQTFGSGTGATFQKLSKNVPLFAIEYAAIGLRHQRKHWGPINTRKAQLRPEADKLFLRIQNLVDAGGICPLVL